MASTHARTRFEVNVAGVGIIDINGEPVPVHGWEPGTYDLAIAPAYTPPVHEPEGSGAHEGAELGGMGSEPGANR